MWNRFITMFAVEFLRSYEASTWLCFKAVWVEWCSSWRSSWSRFVGSNDQRDVGLVLQWMSTHLYEAEVWHIFRFCFYCLHIYTYTFETLSEFMRFFFLLTLGSLCDNHVFDVMGLLKRSSGVKKAPFLQAHWTSWVYRLPLILFHFRPVIKYS